jgi:hypothetical protein
MGQQSRLVGHPVGYGQYLRCNSGAVFTRWRHAVPESRLLTLLSGCGILAEVALDLLSVSLAAHSVYALWEIYAPPLCFDTRGVSRLPGFSDSPVMWLAILSV